MEERRKLEDRREGGPTFKAQFDALLDAAVDAIILIDSDGLITRFNQAAEQLFGYAASEVIGRNVSYLMPQPYRSEHDSYLHRYKTTGEARIIGIGREVTAQRKDGSVFPIELSVGEARRPGAHSFVGIIRDITLRKAHERQLSLQQEELLQRSEKLRAQSEELRAQGEELRLTFDAGPTPIAICNPQLQLVNVNRALLDMLGCDEGELMRLSAREMVLPEDLPFFDGALAQLGNAGEGVRTELRLVRKSGAVVNVLMQPGEVRNDDGSMQFVVITFVDRTTLIAAESEASDLRNRLAHVMRLNTMGEMATGIAHELNQPLSAITNYANASRRLIENGQAELAEIVDALRKISTQAERAGEVIRRLRAMLVRREHQRELVDVAQLIREVIRLAELELRERNIHLSLRLSEDLPGAHVDAVQIQQVLINLIRNGMDAMRETSVGAEIGIAARPRDGMIEIDVSDAGPGISDRVAEHLFEPFYSTKAQGLGMGLAICRSIVQAHGGTLTFSNNRYGGATFTMRLPVNDERNGQ